MSTIAIAALIIFVLTYIGIIFNHLPFTKISRTTVSFAGAVFMILFGVCSFDKAISYYYCPVKVLGRGKKRLAS